LQKNLGFVNNRCLSWNHKTTGKQSDMMTTKETGKESGRDTRMCGDPKTWFPMRVTYQREMKVKAELDRLGIENFVPLRYMMDRTAACGHTIMTVADREMENFMRVASRTDDSVMFLDDETIVGKEGKRVEIMGGAFEGVTGVIRRVKRCKRVVVEIEGVASVAIAWVPVTLLKECGD